MTHPAPWPASWRAACLGGGAGAVVVLLAASLGMAHVPAVPAPTPMPQQVAGAVEAPTHRPMSPPCAAMHRSGGCPMIARAPTRLLRT